LPIALVGSELPGAAEVDQTVKAGQFPWYFDIG
jgi:hypothetical protein